MKIQKRHLLAAALGTLAVGSYASAATIPVTGSPADYTIDEGSGPGQSTNSPLIRVGSGNGGVNGNGIDSVYVFELPDVSGTVQSADLSFYLSSIQDTTNTTYNADLYGIGIKNSTDPLDEYLESETDTSNPNNVKIQNNILVPTSPSGTISTDAGGDNLLAGYLNDFYAANPNYSGSGEYAFLRLNPDEGPLAQKTGYIINVADSGSDHKPVLTLNTVVPEPASLALLGLGGLTMLGRRRRRA